MLLHTLYENGVMNISELENYVHDDVERGSNRLDDLHRRLQTSYQDLLSVSFLYVYYTTLLIFNRIHFIRVLYKREKKMIY